MQTNRYAIEAQRINRFYDSRAGMLPDEVRESLLQSAQPIPAKPGWMRKLFFFGRWLSNRKVLTMKWITRERVKVDRVACPWLIKKFVDPQAEFLFAHA